MNTYKMEIKERLYMFSEAQRLLLFVIIGVVLVPLTLSEINWHNVKYLIRGQMMVIARNVYFRLR